MTPLVDLSRQRLLPRIVKVPWTVTSDERTPRQIAHDAERRGRLITESASDLIFRAREEGTSQTSYGFLVIQIGGSESNPRELREILDFASGMGLLCCPTIVPALLLAEKYSQEELGFGELMVCHEPVRVLRKGSLSKSRLCCLTLVSSDDAQDGITTRRLERKKHFWPRTSFVFAVLQKR